MLAMAMCETCPTLMIVPSILLFDTEQQFSKWTYLMLLPFLGWLKKCSSKVFITPSRKKQFTNSKLLYDLGLLVKKNTKDSIWWEKSGIMVSAGLLKRILPSPNICSSKRLHALTLLASTKHWNTCKICTILRDFLNLL